MDAERETRTTCPYCGVGCGVVIEHDGERVTGVRGDPDHPANFGRLCSKGLTLPLTRAPSARAMHPELRTSRDAPRERASWDTALDHAARRFADAIRAHGPDSVAFYVSGQFLTEDYYAFNKLAKGLIGTNNVDTNSRLCMSSAVTGYKATLGSDAPPCSYEDLEHADCVFVAGSNAAIAHPVLWRRFEQARARTKAKLIVVDPRRTDTAQDADLHLAIAPGTDVALFQSMLHVMFEEGLVDSLYLAQHTEDFEAAERAVRDCTPQWAAALCEVNAADIVTAARWFAASRATLSLYCQGLNQSSHGTDKNAALIHLHLATAQIGRAGAGPFSLTGQPNAMGGREVGGLATALSAHRDLDNPVHRAEVAKLWGVESVPAKRGLTAVEIFEALEAGSLKCVWIACTNPAQSMPDQARVRAGLARAPFVVLQDCYRDIETAPYADLLLPAAGWGEKEGTVTNSERRISRVRRAIAPPGEARADWAIAVDFARRLGPMIGRDAARLFPYENPAQIFAEHAETTRGRDLDITGLTYEILEARGPQQWPMPEGVDAGRARLYEDGNFPTATGRARFAVLGYNATAEAPTIDHPLRLTTGRLRDQWHGMSRTGRVASLFSHEEEPIAAMHAADMAARSIAEGDLVRIEGTRGTMALRARASQAMRPGDVFIPMHWGSRHVAGAGVNALMPSARDRHSHQPELKHAVVEVERLSLAYSLVAMGQVPDTDAALAALGPLLDRFRYASCGLAGREHPLVVLRAARSAPLDPETLAAVDAIFGLRDVEELIAYRDPARGIDRLARVADGKLVAARLAGDVAGASWMQEWIAEGRDAASVGFAILAPTAMAPGGGISRGRTICTCHGVGEAQIAAAFARGTSLEAVQRELKCGTGCGSCVPELKRLQAAQAQPVALAA